MQAMQLVERASSGDRLVLTLSTVSGSVIPPWVPMDLEEVTPQSRVSVTTNVVFHSPTFVRSEVSFYPHELAYHSYTNIPRSSSCSDVEVLKVEMDFLKLRLKRAELKISIYTLFLVKS